MRVYLPATLDLLRGWHRAGAAPASAERYVAAGEDEESEYAALMAAADASSALPDGAGRRVVLVADLPDPDAEVPWRLVASVHADTEERAGDADPDDDLAWYATQEVPALLGE